MYPANFANNLLRLYESKVDRREMFRSVAAADHARHRPPTSVVPRMTSLVALAGVGFVAFRLWFQL